MVTLFYERYSLTIPENYNECTGEQLEKMGAVFLQALPELDARIALLRVLGNRGGWWWRRLPPEALERMVPHVDWALDPENLLTEQKFFEIKANGRNINRFWGPKSELKNCTLAEFHEAEMAYRKMVDKVPGALDELCAILWREGKRPYNLELDKDGDVRHAFNQNTVPWRMKLFKRWPAGRKWACGKFFDSCRQLVVQRFPDVFEGGEATQDAFDGMFKLMRGLAENGKWGDMEKIEKMNVYTAMYELTLSLREQAESKASMAPTY